MYNNRLRIIDLNEIIALNVSKHLIRYGSIDEYDNEYIYLGVYLISSLITKSCLLLVTSIILSLTEKVFIMAVIFLLKRFFSNIVFKLTTVVYLFQMISVIPITYRIMNENYNNYLNYK